MLTDKEAITEDNSSIEKYYNTLRQRIKREEDSISGLIINWLMTSGVEDLVEIPFED
jgi:hypothetical protein